MEVDQSNKTLAWFCIGGGAFVFVIFPLAVLFSVPLYLGHGPLMTFLIQNFLMLAPILAIFGGILALSGHLKTAGLMMLVAGIGMLISWLGPVGIVLCPVFAGSGVKMLMSARRLSKTADLP